MTQLRYISPLSNRLRFFYFLTPWVPSALVMQGLVDVSRIGCSSLAAHSADIHQSEDTLCHSDPLTDVFHPKYPSSNELFMCQKFKTNYNVVPYGDHGTERVKLMCSPWHEPTCFCLLFIQGHILVCPHRNSIATLNRASIQYLSLSGDIQIIRSLLFMLSQCFCNKYESNNKWNSHILWSLKMFHGLICP